MKTILVYTFRTYPYISELKTLFPDVFVFDKLKESFKEITEILIDGDYNYILGIADNNGESKMESVCVNIFNKNKKVSKDGKEVYNLYIKEIGIDINDNFSTSFCNWTMYKLSEFINTNNLDVKISFIHLNHYDIEKFKK